MYRDGLRDAVYDGPEMLKIAVDEHVKNKLALKILVNEEVLRDHPSGDGFQKAITSDAWNLVVADADVHDGDLKTFLSEIRLRPDGMTIVRPTEAQLRQAKQAPAALGQAPGRRFQRQACSQRQGSGVSVPPFFLPSG